MAELAILPKNGKFLQFLRIFYLLFSCSTHSIVEPATFGFEIDELASEWVVKPLWIASISLFGHTLYFTAGLTNLNDKKEVSFDIKL